MRAIVRGPGGGIANGLGGGIMALGDPPLDAGGDVRMAYRCKVRKRLAWLENPKHTARVEGAPKVRQ